MLAAALYAALTMPAWLYGYGGFLERSVCETFIVLCRRFTAWSVVPSCSGVCRGGSGGMGLAAGAAVVLKPNAGLIFRRCCCGQPCTPRPSRHAPPACRGGRGAAVLPAVALIWLWRLDLLREARIAVVDFNRFYVGQGFEPTAYALDFAKAVWLRMKTDPLWLCWIDRRSSSRLADLARRRKIPPLPALAMVLGCRGRRWSSW